MNLCCLINLELTDINYNKESIKKNPIHFITEAHTWMLQRVYVAELYFHYYTKPENKIKVMLHFEVCCFSKNKWG